MTERPRAEPLLLVVDDDPDVGRFVTLALRGTALRVRVAGDAPRALAAADAEWPDLILLDPGLPGAADGWALWDALAERALGRPLRVVIFGGAVSGVDRARLRERGGLDAWAKPLFAPDLARRVRRALGGL